MQKLSESNSPPAKKAPKDQFKGRVRKALRDAIALTPSSIREMSRRYNFPHVALCEAAQEDGEVEPRGENLLFFVWVLSREIGRLGTVTMLSDLFGVRISITEADYKEWVGRENARDDLEEQVWRLQKLANLLSLQAHSVARAKTQKKNPSS